MGVGEAGGGLDLMKLPEDSLNLLSIAIINFPVK